MRFDLHTHSNNSDGALPPAEVVRRARDAGLDGIALTDHDSTAGLAEAEQAGRELGVEVLPGCEVSSRLGDAGVHMLAYFIDPAHPRWVQELAWIRDDRVARAEAMVDRLRALGVPITLEQVRALARGESIGRPHIAQALVDLGVVERTPDAFAPEWIGDGGRAYVEKRVMTPHDTVRLIVEAGGVAAVAHPIWVEREGATFEALLEELVAIGLGALEVNHPDHELEHRVRFERLARRHDLIVTSSSDFHGNEHGGLIGSNAADETVVAALRARAASML